MKMEEELEKIVAERHSLLEEVERLVCIRVSSSFNMKTYTAALRWATQQGIDLNGYDVINSRVIVDKRAILKCDVELSYRKRL